jgi:NAD(P)-dependent dehydrogenase (short-subunit alcohol dehydrogenase family)
MDIKGKVALVTGANRGLGRAITEALLAAGAAKVYGAVRDPKSLAIPGVMPLQLDVTDPASIAAAAAAAPDVALVVNNAGIFQTGSALAPEALDAAERMLATNTFGAWRVAQAFAPALAKSGGGAIVNVLSALSWVVIDGTAAYSVSKAAAWAMTNGLRKALAGQNTQVVGVHIAYMDTDMAAGVPGPKTSPVDVARQIVEAITEGRSEVLADAVTRQVKGGLSAAAAPYL